MQDNWRRRDLNPGHEEMIPIGVFLLSQYHLAYYNDPQELNPSPLQLVNKNCLLIQDPLVSGFI